MRKKLILSLIFAATCISRVWAGDEPPTAESNKHLIDMVQSHNYIIFDAEPGEVTIAKFKAFFA